MPDLRTFSGNIGGYGVTITKNINSLVQNVAKVAVRELVHGTPVDTGRARSNWVASVDAPDDNEIDPHAPGRHLGIAETANAQATIDAADKIIETREPGQDIYIQNNVDYIGSLNNGSSSQAPAAFVEQAAQVTADKIKNAHVLVSATEVIA